MDAPDEAEVELKQFFENVTSVKRYTEVHFRRNRQYLKVTFSCSCRKGLQCMKISESGNDSDLIARAKAKLREHVKHAMKRKRSSSSSSGGSSGNDSADSDHPPPPPVEQLQQLRKENAELRRNITRLEVRLNAIAREQKKKNNPVKSNWDEPGSGVGCTTSEAWKHKKKEDLSN